MDEHKPFEDIAAQGEPATPDALRQIVARHQRARTRTLGIALAIVLVAGPLAGWAVGQSSGGGHQVVTASRPEPATDANRSKGGASGAAGAQAFAISGDPNGPKATRLFTRTSSDGIVIRAYRMDPPPAQAADTSSTTTKPSVKTQEAPCPAPASKPGAPPPQTETGAVSSGSASASAVSGSSSGSNVASPGVPGPDGPPPCPPPPSDCKATPAVMAELSTDAAVGQGFDPIDEKQPSEALSHLSTGMFGIVENAPAMWVTVQIGPGVSAVRLRLPSGATDQMVPVNGVAVLAHTTLSPPPDGTVVEALDSSGKVIGSIDVTKDQEKPGAMYCAVVDGPVPVEGRPVPPTTR